LLECHVNLDLEGFEDRSPEGETTGIKLPYIVTIELESSEVLSIRRNYLPADPKKARVEYFVHFKFFTWSWILWLWFNSYDWWFIYVLQLLH
jgi:hypothetical protein